MSLPDADRAPSGPSRTLATLGAGSVLIGMLGAPLQPAYAQSPAAAAPLPDPLSLEAALALAGGPYPEVDQARAELDIARLELEREDLLDVPGVELDILARVADPASGASRARLDDAMTRVRSTQTGDTSGHRRARRAVAESRVAEHEIGLRHTQRMRRCKIVRRFFDVLLADLRYQIEDESMTVAFLRYDRLRERRTLFDSTSEIDVLEAAAAYRRALVHRGEARLEQKRSRRLLAAALGHPAEIPGELVRPDVSRWTGRRLPQPLDEQDLAGSLVIQAADQRRETTRAALALAARRSALQLDVPAEQDQEAGLARSLTQAGIRRADAQRQQVAQELVETLSGLIDTLHLLELKKAAADTHESYRDLYMDRSRALFEMEVRADLGDAQARLLEATRRSMRVDFEIAATWARLDCLLGRSIIPTDPGETG